MSWAVWITGLPGSGKSAIAQAAAAALQARGEQVMVLELDRIRKVITPEPTYSDAEREAVYRALVYMAAALVDAGVAVILDATAHRRAWRELARTTIPNFAEVQLRCALEICRERTRLPGAAPAGIYDQAALPGATVPGLNVEYEYALAPELTIDTSARARRKRRPTWWGWCAASCVRHVTDHPPRGASATRICVSGCGSPRGTRGRRRSPAEPSSTPRSS